MQFIIKKSSDSREAIRRIIKHLGVMNPLSIAGKASQPRKNLRQVIDRAEADFAAGKGKTFTVEQLEAMLNE